MVNNVDAQVLELACMGSTQHQVTNHGMTGMMHPTRFDDDAYNGRSSAVVVKLTDAFIHHVAMIRHSCGEIMLRRRKHTGVDMAIKVGIDQGVDQKALRRFQDQSLIELHQANKLEQSFPKVVHDKKGFMIGHTYLGRDLLADEKIIRELERIIGTQNRKDIGHIYAAYLNRWEYFVTNDVTDFIKGERNERLEALLGVKVRSMGEFQQEITRA